MAKRFTDTEIWDKEWFMALNPKYKCLIRFLFDKCDIAGVWSANWILASSYIGEPVSEKDLSILGDRVVKIAPAKFFVVEFIEFQYGSLSENCKPHQKILSLLKKYQIEFDENKGYVYPIQRVKDKDKDKEEEEDKDKSIRAREKNTSGCTPNSISTAPEVDEFVDTTSDEEEGFEENEISPDPYPFDLFWDLYDKKVGKPESLARWKLLSEMERAAIIDYIPKYRRAQPDKKFRKDPERFLKKRAWLNEIIEETALTVAHGNTTTQTKQSTAEKIASRNQMGDLARQAADALAAKYSS